LTYYIRTFDNFENWGNNTLDDFLEALGAYTQYIQIYYDNIKLNVTADKAELSIFADIFKRANVYE